MFVAGGSRSTEIYVEDTGFKVGFRLLQKLPVEGNKTKAVDIAPKKKYVYTADGASSYIYDRNETGQNITYDLLKVFPSQAGSNNTITDIESAIT